jgi:uncharacterized protein YidB (DUF937 family)
MGLLDQALGSVLGGRSAGMSGSGGGRSPIVNVVLMALAAKALQHYLAQRRAQSSPAGQVQTGSSGGLGDLIGGLGGLLGGLAGAGGLGSFLSQFNTHGLGDTARSWVDMGQNQPIAPDELKRVLGPEAVQQLSSETGMEPQALLSDLSKALPEAIDHLTPNGQLPSEAELQQVAAGLETGLGAQGQT